MFDSTSRTTIVGAALAAALGACSASGGGPDPLLQGSGTGGTGTFLNGGGGAGGDGGASNVGGGFITVGSGATPGAGASGGGGGGNDACGVVQRPEQIIQYAPVALYIMQDRSGSMVTGFPSGSAQSWGNSTNALGAFVSDPQSNGLDVGLAFFPPTSNNTSPACTGAECGVPAVEIGPIAQTGPKIGAAMNSSQPQPLNFTPTECGLNGMIQHCLQHKQATGEQCVGILITDGDPTTCDTNIGNLSKIVAAGLQQGVKTFVIRLPGVSNPAGLDQVAAAGGTQAAIDVSAGAGAFIGALNAIRGQVAVGTALPCQWKIPAPPNGQTFDPAKVNISFTPKGGVPKDFGYVQVADCARATDAWYFDTPPPGTPTQVFVCPKTCDMLKASQGAEVDVTFGCATKPAVIM
jgi:hypothetical protein